MVEPTDTLKFTLVVSWIFSDLMAETIWLRFSAGGAAVAEVAALPVVDCLASVPLVWAFVVGSEPLVWAFVAAGSEPLVWAFVVPFLLSVLPLLLSAFISLPAAPLSPRMLS